jgi:hypothetical protein
VDIAVVALSAATADRNGLTLRLMRRIEIIEKKNPARWPGKIVWAKYIS